MMTFTSVYQGIKGQMLDGEGTLKLDFKDNRCIPPRYLGASQHWAYWEFFQTEKSCV